MWQSLKHSSSGIVMWRSTGVLICVACLSGCSSSNTADSSPVDCCDLPPPVTKSITLTVPDYLSSSLPSGNNGDITYTFNNWLARTNGVSVYDFSDGMKGVKLGEFSIASNSFQVILDVSPTTSALLLEARAPCNWEQGNLINANLFNRIESYGSYTTGAYVCLTDTATVKAVITADTQSVSVTPFTHVATALAEYRVSQGDAASVAVVYSNAAISSMIGVNIQTTDTSDKLSDMVYMDAPEVFYTMILGGIPNTIINQMAQAGVAISIGQTGYRVYDFATLMWNDMIGDGLLDGYHTDMNNVVSAIQLGGSGLVQLTTNTYRHKIAAYASLHARVVTGGYSSLPNLNRLIAYNGYIGSPFDNSAIIPLDENGPLLGFLPGTETFYSVNPNVNGDLHVTMYFGDIVGTFDYTYRDVFIDNVFYGNTCDGSNLSDYDCWVNTTLFANGPHTMKMVFTNILGHSVTKSITVNFQN